jgi:DNA invertase Pin-like site-specific DNA recombinase
MNALKPRPPFQVLVMSEVSRLGREQIETAYALKQLSQAGVRCFGYLDGRELLMESATDKFLLSAVNFAADLEREKARQRTYDAMARKAKAGHVCGGRTFGYDNVEILDAGGKRSHVEWRINEAEAAVVRRLFELAAAGYGLKGITKALNAEGARSPRPQRGRLQSWAPSSVRAVLHRSVYRGVVTWNRTRKRNQWGQQHQAARPPADWITRPVPDLQIVSDDLWQAAHARIEAARIVYLDGTGGHRFGRTGGQAPLVSKYLLTHLVVCGICGGPLEVQTRAHGKRRAQFYGCAAHRERGTCATRQIVPMADANGIVIEALLDDVLDPTIIRDAVDEACTLIAAADAETPDDRLARELAMLDREQARILAAIETGRHVSGVFEALQALDRRRRPLPHGATRARV